MKQWATIEQTLKQESPPRPRSSEAFWAEFRARAALVNQDHPLGTSPAGTAWLRWATAAAALVALASWLTVSGLRTPADTDSGGGYTVAQAETNQIKTFSVAAPHAGVIILNNAEHRGTIMWIADMKLSDGEGG